MVRVRKLLGARERDQLRPALRVLEPPQRMTEPAPEPADEDSARAGGQKDLSHRRTEQHLLPARRYGHEWPNEPGTPCHAQISRRSRQRITLHQPLSRWTGFAPALRVSGARRLLQPETGSGVRFPRSGADAERP